MSEVPQYIPQMPQMPQPVYVQQGPKNGLGNASFVLGIIGLAFSFIPFAGLFMTLPVALTGLGVGLGGVSRLFKNTADNKVLTWIGVGLSLIAIPVCILLFIAAASAVSTTS